ncbi:hypothetical protein H9P43_001813 [Blastocladiella emersonii ATCC 22665]|nr:hypothetical protein H9P43_001813 [Blastocladiella emersonii ATCC 22665]
MSNAIYVKALFEYQPAQPDELFLAAGAVVKVLDGSEADWLFGEDVATGKQGWFPENYITPIAEPDAGPAPSLPARAPPKSPPPVPSAAPTAAPPAAPPAAAPPAVPQSPPPAEPTAASPEPEAPEQQQPQEPRKARVEYDYSPQNQGELALAAGETITILTTDSGVHGWYRGEANGATGIFPANHVKLLDGAGIEEKQRKLAAYGVRIGGGLGSIFGGVPLKKPALPAAPAPVLPTPAPAPAPTSSDDAAPRFPSLPRRPAPGSPVPGPASGTASPVLAASPLVQPSAAAGHQRTSSIPKLPAGLSRASTPQQGGAGSPVMLPQRVNSIDSVRSSHSVASAATSPALHKSPELAPRPMSPPTAPAPVVAAAPVTVDPEPVAAEAPAAVEEKLAAEADSEEKPEAPAAADEEPAAAPLAIPAPSNPPLASLTKARPAQAKRPPSNLRALSQTTAAVAAPVLPPKPSEAAAPAPAEPAPVPARAASPHRAASPPSVSTAAPAIESPEPTKPESPAVTAATPTSPSTPPVLGRLGRVSSAIANLQANLAGMGGSGSGAAGGRTNPPPVPGAKPLFGGFGLRRATPTPAAPAPATESEPASPKVSTDNLDPHRGRAAPRSPSPVGLRIDAAAAGRTGSSSSLSGAAADAPMSPGIVQGAVARARAGSPSPRSPSPGTSPTRTKSPVVRPVSTASRVSSASASTTTHHEWSNGIAQHDDDNAPSMATVMGMVKALQIEVNELQAALAAEKRAREALEVKVAAMAQQQQQQ